MEAEIRAILTEAVQEREPDSLFAALRERFAALGGVELDVPARHDSARRVDLAS
jgi:plasmid stability protein